MSDEALLVVDVQVACRSAGIPSSSAAEAWVRRALSASGTVLSGVHEVSVRVVDRDEMRALNRDYRQQDQVTNVLSFPAETVAGLPGTATQVLGDIVVCAERVAEEAGRQGKALDDHWAHLLVHGTLHLLGYDHQADADAVEMEDLEARILAEYGVSDPYEVSPDS